jgi:hypothetical protein
VVVGAVQGVWLAVRKIGRGVAGASVFVFTYFSSLFSFFLTENRGGFRFFVGFFHEKIGQSAARSVRFFPALRAISESDPIVRCIVFATGVKYC